MRSRAIALMVVAGLLGLGLTPGAGAAGPGPDPKEPVQVAIQHVRAHPARYGVSAGDLSDLVVTDAYRSAHTGVAHVYLRQRTDGLEVAGSSITVNVAPGGEVIHVGSRLVPDLASASGRLELGAPEAADAAARALGLTPTTTIAVLETSPGVARRTLLSGGGVSAQPIPAKLVYQALEDGRIRLAWNVEIEERSGLHWWNASVDAETGTLLASFDYVDHDDASDIAAATARPGQERTLPAAAPAAVPDGSSYRVYAVPLESPNDGPRTLVENPADADASPWGWHDTNGAAGPEFTTTQGNNVHAYIDTFNAGMGLPLTDADGGPGLDFDFPYDPSLPPTAYKDAAVTNLFYWSNIIHDVFYRFGFDEASGNFQVNNYGRGGLGADSLRAEAQDGSGANNANFSTPTDGSRPRMQMYLWTSTFTSNRQLIDGDFDAGVIIHEYSHGISNRLTGGPNTGGCLSHQEREGEGWSDWQSIALTALETESGPQRRGMGTFVLGQPNRQGAGIRPTPYSTNMAINGATYDDIKTLAVPHGVGYVWATMLWEVFWDLVAKHGFNPNVYEDWTTGGNNLAHQLVMDGMKFQPCSPGFADARDAILAADVALTDGDNQCLIWRGFAKRGLGYSANQGSPSSRSDGTEAFDTHPECRPRAVATPESLSVSVSPGGSAAATLTVGNGARPDGQDLTWSLSESITGCASSADIAWLGATPASGTTPAAGGTDVTVTFDASGLSPGTQTGSLCIASNDGANPTLALPVTLEVTES